MPTNFWLLRSPRLGVVHVDSEGPRGFAWTVDFALQSGREVDDRAVHLVAAAYERLPKSEHRNAAHLRGWNRLQRERCTRPSKTQHVDNMTDFCLREAYRRISSRIVPGRRIVALRSGTDQFSAFLPQFAGARSRSVDRLAIHCEPCTDLLQLVESCLVESAIGARSDADYEVASLGNDVGEIANDPGVALETIVGAAP